MSKQAFDQLLAQLEPQARENIYAMAAAYGLSFDDPAWVLFAVTRATLEELKAQIDLSAEAIEEAADNALRKVGADVQGVSEQARAVIAAQAKWLQTSHQALRAAEKNALARFEAALAEHAAAPLQTLTERASDGITENVSQRLIGQEGLLAQSAVEHAKTLEQSRQRFSQSIDAAVDKVDAAGQLAVGTTRTAVFRTVWLAAVAAVLSATVAISVMLFESTREADASADLIRAYAAQRDDLLKQVEGAKQLLASQRTGYLSLRYYGSDLYLLAPRGVSGPGRSGNSGLLNWLMPGGTPRACVSANEGGASPTGTSRNLSQARRDLARCRARRCRARPGLLSEHRRVQIFLHGRTT
ncbi:hypothetical protein [Ralstonia sp. 1138]|uniref:hypothetical protein n=1 Tax=Ralstonia sp. 1138 TaxID=3156423 RepID=UPI00339851DD